MLHDVHNGAHLVKDFRRGNGAAHALIDNRQFPQSEIPTVVVRQHLVAGDRQDGMDLPYEQHVVHGGQRRAHFIGQKAIGFHFNEG